MQLFTLGVDYELARTFHPDSPTSQALPSSVRHARFHAVTRAYDILRGRSHLGHSSDDVYAAELARRRRQHARRQPYHDRVKPKSAEAEMSGIDDAWKDQVIIVVGLVVRLLFPPSL
jgi:DnaJ-class molecular chaperone